jgi:hypothetical protein
MALAKATIEVEVEIDAVLYISLWKKVLSEIGSEIERVCELAGLDLDPNDPHCGEVSRYNAPENYLDRSCNQWYTDRHGNIYLNFNPEWIIPAESARGCATYIDAMNMVGYDETAPHTMEDNAEYFIEVAEDFIDRIDRDRIAGRYEETDAVEVEKHRNQIEWVRRTMAMLPTEDEF